MRRTAARASRPWTSTARRVASRVRAPSRPRTVSTCAAGLRRGGAVGKTTTEAVGGHRGARTAAESRPTARPRFTTARGVGPLAVIETASATTLTCHVVLRRGRRVLTGCTTSTSGRPAARSSEPRLAARHATVRRHAAVRRRTDEPCRNITNTAENSSSLDAVEAIPAGTAPVDTPAAETKDVTPVWTDRRRRGRAVAVLVVPTLNRDTVKVRRSQGSWFFSGY